jgi:hydroxyacylglutathione hydrolase
MLLKYFYDAKLAHASYLVGCQAVGEAIVIDPGRDVAPYLQEAEANEMRLAAVAETHIHADFVSGARELAERSGARLYLSDEGDADWKYSYHEEYDHQLLVDGDHFKVGNIRFEVVHTPGHTPEHICFLVTDTAGADKPIGIFSGDFVFAGAAGRPDLLEKAAGISGTAAEGARRMFHSLQRFKQLPDYLQVWPGHGAGSACGKGLGSIPSTTAGYEKLFNPALAYDDEEAFIRYLLADQPEPPRYFAVMKRVNKEGPAILRDLPEPPALPVVRLPELLAGGAQVVDTRETDAFAAQHLAGTINIPAGQLSAWAGWLVNYETPLYLIATPGAVTTIVRDLRYIGIDQIGGYFDTAAMEALAATDYPRQSYAGVRPAEIAGQILNGDVVLLDVRNQAEWQEARLPNGRHLMLGYLPQRAHELASDKPVVVQCRTGNRSAIAASILQAHGVTAVLNLEGGIHDWQAAGLPVEKPPAIGEEAIGAEAVGEEAISVSR